ncbi:MAG: CgeB family protein [Streptosporangiaceae bacterium]
MQVGVIGPVSPDYFADNVGDALTRIGHSVTYLGPARARLGSGRLNQVAGLARQVAPGIDERFQRAAVRRAQSADCEVVINLDASLMPDAVLRLRRQGMKVAFWFPDAVCNLGRQLMLLSCYDALFFKDPLLVDRLRDMLDLPVHYLPQGCNPRWHRPAAQAGTDPHLVIAGNMYPSRVRLLDRLIEKGIPLRIYGAGFPRWLGETRAREAHAGCCIFRAEKARVFRSAAGVLNNLHPAEMNSMNARLFEAAGSGAAVLTEFRPALPELFDVGREVLAFSDFEELLDQATRLLNDPGLTARIGNAAAERALREHTYDLRVAALLTTLS